MITDSQEVICTQLTVVEIVGSWRRRRDVSIGQKHWTKALDKPFTRAQMKKNNTGVAGAMETESSFIGLALGGGAAKGLAHIPVLEAFDEIGVRPSVIAGTSIGAIIGACYASGMTGSEIRNHALELFTTRRELLRRIFLGESQRWSSIFSLIRPGIVAPEVLLQAVLPRSIPQTVEELSIPLLIVATDYYAQEEVVLDHGPLVPAIGASSSLPGLLSPISLKERTLIDGGFVNPTPFDIIKSRVQFTIAVDVTGRQDTENHEFPGPLRATISAFQIALHSLVQAKLACVQPDLLLRPNVGAFDGLEFYKVREILDASQPVKDQLKRGIEALLETGSK